jgi:ornithine carbamoyltransferase
MENFLSIHDYSASQLKELLQLSSELKKLYKAGGHSSVLYP